MKFLILFCLVTLLLVRPCWSETATSDWLSAPKPKFPPAALKGWSEGSVRLRIVITKDGTVAAVTISKSSGDSTLDQTARTAVLKWRMNPGAIKPLDLTKGREQLIEFRQEAWAAALYRDKTTAYFHHAKGSTISAAAGMDEPHFWMYAPFPSYSLRARERRETGKVILKVRLGDDGRVAEIQKVQSSGYPDLDDAAIAAVRFWRAHRRFAGTQGLLPINFVMTAR